MPATIYTILAMHYFALRTRYLTVRLQRECHLPFTKNFPTHTERRYFFWLVNVPTMTKLHDNLIDATLGASFAFLADEDTGSILNRFSSDINLATQRIPALIVPTIWREFLYKRLIRKSDFIDM